mmetsp:Transcript_24813/g.51924  ORF Transcript_24813/g.51924 Transcript_24813/m.51924 type:complete len:381 (+) Transcript_24813:791-1933(+)
MQRAYAHRQHREHSGSGRRRSGDGDRDIHVPVCMCVTDEASHERESAYGCVRRVNGAFAREDGAFVTRATACKSHGAACRSARRLVKHARSHSEARGSSAGLAGRLPRRRRTSTQHSAGGGDGGSALRAASAASAAATAAAISSSFIADSGSSVPTATASPPSAPPTPSTPPSPLPPSPSLHGRCVAHGNGGSCSSPLAASTLKSTLPSALRPFFFFDRFALPAFFRAVAPGSIPAAASCSTATAAPMCAAAAAAASSVAAMLTSDESMPDAISVISASAAFKSHAPACTPTAAMSTDARVAASEGCASAELPSNPGVPSAESSFRRRRCRRPTAIHSPAALSGTVGADLVVCDMRPCAAGESLSVLAASTASCCSERTD